MSLNKYLIYKNKYTIIISLYITINLIKWALLMMVWFAIDMAEVKQKENYKETLKWTKPQWA